MDMTWLTSARMKSLATLVAAMASALAVVIAAFKPTGIESSAKAYDLLRAEVMTQRGEIMELNRSVAEMNAWLKLWKEHEEARAAAEDSRADRLETKLQPTLRTATRGAMPPVASVRTAIVPPPPPPPPAPALGQDRELPTRDKIF